MKKISSRKNLRLILSFIRFGEPYSFVLEAILESILKNASSVVITVPRSIFTCTVRDNITTMIFRLIGRYPVVFYDHSPSPSGVQDDGSLFVCHPLCDNGVINLFVRLT